MENKIREIINNKIKIRGNKIFEKYSLDVRERRYVINTPGAKDKRQTPPPLIRVEKDHRHRHHQNFY